MITALTERFGLAHPILNAPMSPQAGGAMARAVSASGALGMLGFDEDEPIASLREQVALARAEPRRPFGIGLVRWVVDRRPELIDIALEARPALVSFSFGDPAPYVARLKAANITVAAQVQSRSWAERALAAGVDILIAQGTEAGGHTGVVGTLPLLQIILELAGDVPVLAAGGIATGRGLAAVLAAGAAGAWIGTPFLAASEARTNPAARERLIASGEGDTILTSAFDRAARKAWPPEFRGRAIRNAFAVEWDGREDAITDDARERFVAAKRACDYDVGNLYAGQTVGFLKRESSAATIVETIARDAERHLRDAMRTFASADRER